MKRFLFLCVPVLLLGVGLVGCGSGETSGEKPAASGDERPTGAGQTPVTTKGPMGDPHAAMPGEGKKADMGALEKAQVSAEAAFKKAPNDAKAKKAFVDATVELGTATMYAPDLTPREKYAGALKFYRVALKLDPENKEAKENAQMIEDIYRQMGRPIPE